MAAPTDSRVRSKPPRIVSIVIIGGGFSGAVVALNLLRRLPPHAARITVIEPRPLLGGGVAYSSADPAHRLNVPASRMLVLPEEPHAFETWLKASGKLADDPEALLADGRIYPRRGVFGIYLDGLVRTAAAAQTSLNFRHIQSPAIAISKRDDGIFQTTVADATIDADIVVLAVSHPPPAVPKPLQRISEHTKFIASPWPDNALAVVGPRDRVLIIGTALSTADVIASLQAQGHTGEILAISRRGLVSRLRTMTQTEPFGDFSTQPSRTAVALLGKVRKTIVKAEAAGSSWGAVMDTLRVQGLIVWSALPPVEKSRFLRHLRPFWDVHRYQVAPQLAAISEAQCEAGKLAIRAARIHSAHAANGKFQIQIRFRGAAPTAEPSREQFDTVINCTGPDHSNVTTSNPILASLEKSGLISADEFGLGLQTDLTARAIDATGAIQPNLFVAGPLARATFGELMGLPQVSLHARLVAAEIEQFLL